MNATYEKLDGRDLETNKIYEQIEKLADEVRIMIREPKSHATGWGPINDTDYPATHRELMQALKCLRAAAATIRIERPYSA